MVSGGTATLCEVALIINFLKNRIMENYIYCYLAASYLVMFGFASYLCYSKGLTIEDKSDLAIVAVLLLFAPLSLPILAGRTLFKLLGE